MTGMEIAVALLAIVAIDLVLAGDNAIVIGMAARKLPQEHQKKAIFWGTFGAIAIRAVASVVVVYLLKIPGLLLVGGLLLVWIAYKLLVEDEKDHKEVSASASVWAAVRTIVIADAAMGVDNVIAVAGAAHGNPILVIIGLLISVPIIVWGSTLFIKLVTKFPWIIYAGAGILAFTAAKMIVGEGFVQPYFANPLIKYPFELAVIALVLLAGKRANDRRKLAVPAPTPSES